MHRLFAGPIRFALSVILIGALMLGAAAVAAHARFGSVTGGLRYLRGERFYVVEPVKDLGVVEAGKKYQVDYKIVNNSQSNIRLIGCTASCGCTVPQQLPMEVRPGVETEFKLDVTPQSGASQAIEIHLLTDHPQSPDILLRVVMATTAVHQEPISHGKP